MKFEIGKEEVLEEKPLNIWLEKFGDRILLRCTGGWNILAIKEDGTIALSSGLPNKLGFQLIDGGRVKTINP